MFNLKVPKCLVLSVRSFPRECSAFLYLLLQQLSTSCVLHSLISLPTLVHQQNGTRGPSRLRFLSMAMHTLLTSPPVSLSSPAFHAPGNHQLERLPPLSWTNYKYFLSPIWWHYPKYGATSTDSWRPNYGHASVSSFIVLLFYFIFQFFAKTS